MVGQKAAAPKAGMAVHMKRMAATLMRLKSEKFAPGLGGVWSGEGQGRPGLLAFQWQALRGWRWPGAIGCINSC